MCQPEIFATASNDARVEGVKSQKVIKSEEPSFDMSVANCRVARREEREILLYKGGPGMLSG